MAYSSNDDYIEYLSDNPGILLEELAPLVISNTEWKIIQKINLKSYFEKGDILLLSWKEVNVKCFEENLPCQYKQHLRNLNKQIHDAIQEKNHIVELLHGTAAVPLTRARRSVLPFMGRISRVLFGTLDENDEKHLSYIIESASNDTRKLAKLLANQTEIVKTEFGTAYEKISNISSLVASIVRVNTAQEKDNAIGAAVELLNESILQYSLETEILTDAILFSAQGTVHPRLISPESIVNLQGSIKDTVTDAFLPESESILDLIKISQVSILFKDLNLIYHITIPLISSQRFTLVKFSPVPVNKNLFNATDAFFYIWPTSEYVAINKYQRVYMQITVENIERCQKLNSLYICKNTNPVRDVKDETSCEIKMFIDGNNTDMSNCNIKISKLPVTHWAKLHNPNTWIFSAPGRESIFIQCQGQRLATKQIYGTGILRLYSGCSAVTSDARIVGTRTVYARTKQSDFITYNFDMQTIIKNVTNVMNSTDALQHLSQEFASMNWGRKTIRESLDMGVSFDTIIGEAQTISTYRKAGENLANFQTDATIFGGSAISILLILFIGYKLFSCGGPRLLICTRLFPDKKPKTNRASTGQSETLPSSHSVPVEVPMQVMARPHCLAPQPMRQPRETRMILHAPSLPALDTLHSQAAMSRPIQVSRLRDPRCSWSQLDWVETARPTTTTYLG